MKWFCSVHQRESLLFTLAFTFCISLPQVCPCSVQHDELELPHKTCGPWQHQCPCYAIVFSLELDNHPLLKSHVCTTFAASPSPACPPAAWWSLKRPNVEPCLYSTLRCLNLTGLLPVTQCHCGIHVESCSHFLSDHFLPDIRQQKRVWAGGWLELTVVFLYISQQMWSSSFSWQWWISLKLLCESTMF